MTKITNTHKTQAVGLPDGTIIHPNTQVDVPNWSEFKDRPNIKGHLDAGTLSTSAAPESDEDEGGEDGATEVAKMKKPDVIAELEQRGYEVDKSAPVADLRAELEKARSEDQ